MFHLRSNLKRCGYDTNYSKCCEIRVESSSSRYMTGLHFHYKLKCLKNKLKVWNKSTFGHVSQIKDDLLPKVQEMDKKN